MNILMNFSPCTKNYTADSYATSWELFLGHGRGMGYYKGYSTSDNVSSHCIIQRITHGQVTITGRCYDPFHGQVTADVELNPKPGFPNSFARTPFPGSKKINMDIPSLAAGFGNLPQAPLQRQRLRARGYWVAISHGKWRRGNKMSIILQCHIKVDRATTEQFIMTTMQLQGPQIRLVHGCTNGPS